MPGIDDLGIDPWGDLEIIRPTPTVEPTPEQLPPAEIIQAPEPDAAGEGISTYAVSGDMYDVNDSGTFKFTTASAEISTTLGSQLDHKSVDYAVLANVQGYYLTNDWTKWYGSTYLYLNAGATATTYVDVTRSVSVNLNGFSSVKLSGSVFGGFGFIAINRTSSEIPKPSTNKAAQAMIYPTSVNLLINGKVIGDAMSVPSDGRIDLTDMEFDISGSGISVVQTVGFRFNYAGACKSNKQVSIPDNSAGAALHVYLRYQETGFVLDGVAAPTPTPGMTDDERHEETKGFLESIISAIQGIFDAIVNLPGKIVSGLLDGLKSLFVPSEEDLEELKGKYETLLSERLGFIWQAGEWITGFGSDLLAAFGGTEVAEFKFPGVGFEMNGEEIQLISEQVVDFQGNAIVQTLQPYVGTIVAFVVVIGCINVFSDMVTAVISGKSYADFLKGDGGG